MRLGDPQDCRASRRCYLGQSAAGVRQFSLQAEHSRGRLRLALPQQLVHARLRSHTQASQPVSTGFRDMHRQVNIERPSQRVYTTRRPVQTRLLLIRRQRMPTCYALDTMKTSSWVCLLQGLHSSPAFTG